MFTVRESTVRAEVDYDDAWLDCAAKGTRVVWDIGDCVGQAALIMRLAVRFSTPLLVDPNVDALSLAAEKMIHNGDASWIRLCCSFVSPQDNANVQLYIFGLVAAGSRFPGHARSASKPGLNWKVKTVTLEGR